MSEHESTSGPAPAHGYEAPGAPGRPAGPPAGRSPGPRGARRDGADPPAPRREAAGQGGRGAALGGSGEPRLRRAKRPTSPLPAASGRARTADERRYALAARLTGRDRELLHALDRHGVLTAEHAAAAFFGSPTRAKARLLELNRLGAVDRFRPLAPGWGSSPYHYVLGRAGAGVLAAERGEDPAPAERRWSAGRALALAGSQRLAHSLGVSGLWASLAGAQRRGEGEVLLWLTEREAEAAAEGVVRPDAYLVWRERGLRVEAFAEYDRGTEALGRLAGKLGGYARFEAERGRAAWVLFTFESPRREAGARGALARAGAGVPVATATLTGGACPAGPVWLPLGRDGGPRSTLAGLALARMPAEALERAVQGSARAWRYSGLLPEPATGCAPGCAPPCAPDAQGLEDASPLDEWGGAPAQRDADSWLTR